MNKKKSSLLAIIYIFSFIAIAVLANVNFGKIYSLPENFVASYSDIEKVNDDALMGGFVQASLEKPQKSVDDQKDGYAEIVFKLFNLIPIRKVSVCLLPEEEVYVGGVPIGLTISTDGAIVLSDTTIASESGHFEKHKNDVLKQGDIIKSINDIPIANLQDIENALDKVETSEVKVEYLRKNATRSAILKLHKQDGKYRLGVWARDDLSGVGTLTYVDKENKYGALGHAVTDGGSVVPMTDGKVYKCSLLGIEKGQRNAPGQLKCLFIQNDEKGVINKNSQFGIFGSLDDCSDLVDTNVMAKMGGRLSVTPGKAKIVSSVSGIREEYDIEIIKASYQSKSSDKSIVFRVKDKRLIDLTGGIVQGMSGSPIIQNGKLVGAVTHVFLSDPTKGYGVYTDWMVGN